MRGRNHKVITNESLNLEQYTLARYVQDKRDGKKRKSGRKRKGDGRCKIVLALWHGKRSNRTCLIHDMVCFLLSFNR